MFDTQVRKMRGILFRSAWPCLLLFADVHTLVDARRRRRIVPVEDDETLDSEGFPKSWSEAKRREIRLASEAEARERKRRAEHGLKLLPMFPTHTTSCDGRLCRPGEGNIKHETEKGVGGSWRYKQWQQPYEHREWYVQSRSRKMPHGPDAAHYGELVKLAKGVARENLVLVTSGDFDYRVLIWNWLLHVKQFGHSNSVVLSLDRQLHEALIRARVTSFDNSANLEAWNRTCLQRYIQAVRTERHVAVAALVASGLDVLLADATAVLVKDPVPILRSLPSEGDVFVQRDDWPQDPVRKMGCAANAGFYYVRATNANEVVRLIVDAVNRGLIEFYLRWNNIGDQYGWSYVLSESGVRVGTSEFTNTTTIGTIKRWHCMQQGGTCLKVGFLPYDKFPRHGRWSDLASTAYVYHLTLACAQEQSPCFRPGTRPFRGNRQRLNRYDMADFDGMVATLQEVGAWKVGADAPHPFTT